MTTFDRQGISLGYDDAGSGPAILFLHGLSMSRDTWARFVPELEERFRVVRLDQRGHGESAHAGEYILDNYIGDAVAFLEEVVREPCLLVGHSLGGVVAHGVAQLHSDLVRGVLLEDPPLYVADRMASEGEASPVAAFFPMMQQLCRDMQSRGAPVSEYETMLAAVPSMNGSGTMAEAIGAEGVHVMAEAFSRLDPEVLTPAINGTAISGAPDPSATLGCPVVVVRADPALGAAFTPEDEERFLKANAHARVVEFAGASHAIHDEQPERFLAELLELTASVTS